MIEKSIEIGFQQSTKSIFQPKQEQTLVSQPFLFCEKFKQTI